MTYQSDKKQQQMAAVATPTSSSSSSSCDLRYRQSSLSPTTNFNNSAGARRFVSSPSSASSSSVYYMTMMMGVVGSLVVLGLVMGGAEARPTGEIYPPQSLRSGAMQALRYLDNYASKNVRPRFGKRFGNSLLGGGDQEASSPSLDEASLIGADRWVLINRSRPLTKLTESYLREILAENERSNAGAAAAAGGGEPSSESGLMLGAA